MDFEVQYLCPDRVDLDDHTYRITTHAETADLALSICAIGLLQPPTVIEAGDGKFVVVSGFRRLAALKTLDDCPRTVPMRVLPPTTAPMELAAIAISDNAFQRALNVVEQSRCYDLLHRVCNPSQKWRELARACGLPDSGKALKLILPIATMPDTLQQAIVEGSVALPVAHRINNMEANDRRAMIDLLRKITTGLNIQRELVETLTEIAKRDDLPIHTLVAQSCVSDILAREALSTPQKAHQLRHFFKTQRFPALMQAQQSYNQAVGKLHLPPCIQVQPPPFFEGKTYQVILKVESREQVRALQSELQKLASEPTLLPAK